MKFFRHSSNAKLYHTQGLEFLKKNLWSEALEKYDSARTLFESLCNWKEVLHLRAHIADVKWKKENGEISPTVDEYRSIIASFFHKDFYKDLYDWKNTSIGQIVELSNGP